jgi:hypothetical protein
MILSGDCHNDVCLPEYLPPLAGNLTSTFVVAFNIQKKLIARRIKTASCPKGLHSTAFEELEDSQQVHSATMQQSQSINS